MRAVLGRSGKISPEGIMWLVVAIVWEVTFCQAQHSSSTSGAAHRASVTQPPQRTSSPEMENANVIRQPPFNSTSAPETPCPAYCLCSYAESAMSCNGEHIYPFPQQFPANITRLSLQSFQKTELHPLDLSPLHTTNQLTELRLNRNTLSALKASAFVAMKKLKRLDLSENKLSQITNLTFIGLSSLLYLDLSSNRIAAIDPGSFAYLRDLIRLDLNSNRLTKLPNDLFTGLLSLQYLNLEVNHVLQLEPDVFLHVAQLVHLNLALNPLEDFEKIKLDLPFLQYIDLSHSRLQTIPQNLPVSVRDIRLSGNKLGSLGSRLLQRYSSLAILVLDDCNITNLGNDTFSNLQSLQRIWLNGNHIREFPVGLPASLKALYLDENNIKLFWRRDLGKMVNLEEIHLRRNEIKRLEPCSFCDLKHLHLLNLRGNRLDTLNETLFPVVNSILSLDLSANPLRFVGKEFLRPLLTLKQMEMSRLDHKVDFELTMESLPHLTTLDISGSPFIAVHILELMENQDFLPKLHMINLRNCHLSLLDKNLEAFFRRLGKIKMAQNLISCTKPNTWLVDLIQGDPERFFRAPDLKCASPKTHKDRKILSVNSATFGNHSASDSGDKIEGRTRLHQTIPADSTGSDLLMSTLPAEIWIIVGLCCVLSAAVVALGCVLIMGCCPLDHVKTKQRNLRLKVARIFGLRKDPFPDRIDSLRTLYSSCNNSIYTISSEIPGERPHELGLHGPATELQGVVNDGLSSTSTLRSVYEYRV